MHRNPDYIVAVMQYRGRILRDYGHRNSDWWRKRLWVHSAENFRDDVDEKLDPLF
jgi:hypothetical protein